MRLTNFRKGGDWEGNLGLSWWSCCSVWATISFSWAILVPTCQEVDKSRPPPIRGIIPFSSALTQDPAADLGQSQGLCETHLIRGWGLNVKSPKIKICTKIDAPRAAGLSQQPKLCGWGERWMEVTLRDSHMLSCSDGCWRSEVIVMGCDAVLSSSLIMKQQHTWFISSWLTVSKSYPCSKIYGMLVI